MHAPLVLYDGACEFCSTAVRLIRANDPSAHFDFAPLTSERGRAAILAGGRDPDAEPSLLLADADGLHAQSEAAVRIARGLRAPWPLAGTLAGAIPRPLRDAAYRWLAGRRYHLPG